MERASRARVRVQQDLATQAKAETETDGSSSARYPYLPCGYEVERQAPYLRWLQEVRDGGDAATPDYCFERFAVLLGVFAGSSLENPIVWWPVYADTKAGDIAVLRLSGVYVPDEVRNGRTVDISEPPFSSGREGCPAASLPRGQYLNQTLMAAGSCLDPPLELSGGDGPRYLLPPHEVFSEPAFVVGLGPLGLGLVLEDAAEGEFPGYFSAPIGMFLPFPVELFDSLLDPACHEGSWFEGFSVVEEDERPAPIRRSIPEREESESISYLSPIEFRNLTAWVEQEYDPDGWFGDCLKELEEESELIRAAGGSARANSQRDDGEHVGWNTWQLPSPSTTHRLDCLWGIQMITLEERERMIHAVSDLLHLEGIDPEAAARMRYVLQRFEEMTADDARRVAENLLVLRMEGEIHDPLSPPGLKLLDGDDGLPFRRLLVPLAEHQLLSLLEVARLDSEPRTPIPDWTKPESETGRLWSALADDLAQIYLGWVRALVATDPSQGPAVFAIPLRGEILSDLLSEYASFVDALPGEEAEREARAFDQMQGYVDTEERWGAYPTAINSQFWTNPEHEESSSVLVPVSAYEAAACWQASNQYRSSGYRVSREPLDNLADGRKPAWFYEVPGPTEPNDNPEPMDGGEAMLLWTEGYFELGAKNATIDPRMRWRETRLDPFLPALLVTEALTGLRNRGQLAVSQ